jgi:hypothetical protein
MHAPQEVSTKSRDDNTPIIEACRVGLQTLKAGRESSVKPLNAAIVVPTPYFPEAPWNNFNSGSKTGLVSAASLSSFPASGRP